jgi:hypothetical protein
LAHPRDTSRAIAQASLCFCIASKGHRNEPSLENNGNFHKVILKMVCYKFRLLNFHKVLQSIIRKYTAINFAIPYFLSIFFIDDRLNCLSPAGNLKSYHISLFYNTLSLPAGGEFALGDKVL